MKNKKFEIEQVVEVGKASGAGGDDIVDGYKLATEVWGEDACSDYNGAAKAFAYLWRRFGPPWQGSDDYKDLVGYILTTPEPDVFLTLRLCVSGLKYSVGYLARTSIRGENEAAAIEWENKFRDWWWAQEVVLHPEYDKWKKWTKKRKEMISPKFWEDRTQPAIIKKAEKEIGKFPRRKYYDIKDWKKTRGVVHRVNAALVAAMKELLRPVYVRDVPINILGYCDHRQVYENAAEHSKYAGYGMNKEYLDKLIAEDEAKYGKK
jgi:hypothetical protein